MRKTKNTNRTTRPAVFGIAAIVLIAGIAAGGAAYHRHFLNKGDVDGSIISAAEAAETTENEYINLVAGKWRHQVANGSGTVDKGAYDIGIIDIREDSTFTYTDAYNNVITGTVDMRPETWAGGDYIRVDLSGNSDFSLHASYIEGRTDELALGNGYLDRLLRAGSDEEIVLCGEGDLQKGTE